MPDVEVGEPRAATNGISRRRFIGYLIAAPSLVAAADLRAAPPASAAVPTVQPVDFYDLTDLLTDAANLTASLITVTINPDGTASFALPRAEVGQGITTAVAMVIADELELGLDKVNITLSDARPELEFNQLTGGSNSMHVLYDQVRIAAAIARGQLALTAARQLERPLPKLALKDGVITAPDGTSLSYGSLATAAAASRTQAVLAQLKPASQQTLVGTPQPRIDAMEIVTGTKQFAMDLDVPGALPTMVCRPPSINGTVLAVLNEAEVRAMGGVTDVAIIPHTQFVPGGVAVRATTFGQCIDAVRALQVQWAPGAASSKSDADVLQDLINAELPMTPGLGQTLDQRFTFYFRPGDPLETNCAIADVRPDSADISSAMKSPIYFQETVAQTLGLPVSNVTAHVTQGGGSFGRHLFADAAFEAAAISKAMSKPVKLMWHRTDNFRQGRVHPICTSRVRITYLANNVLAFDQRHTSVATDFTHGLGEILSATLGNLPEGDFLGYSQSVFTLTANVPYNFGPVTQLLNEVYHPPGSMFNSSSVRNIYSPEVTVAKELMVDQVAKAMGQDRISSGGRSCGTPACSQCWTRRLALPTGASAWRRSPHRESVSTTSTRATPRVWPRSTARHRPLTGRSTHTFILNGKQVSVDCPDDLRLLWVLRDLLGVHGPKYGCGLDVCKACTCHINGEAFNPCSVPVSDTEPTDQITTIEGLPATVGQELHPVQQA